MLDFVARAFRGWMNFVLWLLLIGCAIGGLITGGSLLGSGGFSGGYAFLGLLVGTIIGLIIVILSGGLIANFLNMVDNIAKIANAGNSSGINSEYKNEQMLSESEKLQKEYEDQLNKLLMNYPDQIKTHIKSDIEKIKEIKGYDEAINEIKRILNKNSM